MTRPVSSTAWPRWVVFLTAWAGVWALGWLTAVSDRPEWHGCESVHADGHDHSDDKSSAGDAGVHVCALTLLAQSLTPALDAVPALAEPSTRVESSVLFGSPVSRGAEPFRWRLGQGPPRV